MSKRWIKVIGARENNLDNVNVQIPRDEITVITGLSGSGKSSLAFDTIYAEGQRKYVESLSAYARQFLGQMQKPDVDAIEGLSPAVSIEQRNAVSNPRSIVATTTEIYDYLRLLFTSIGRSHCHKCKEPVSNQNAEEIVNQILKHHSNSRIILLAPVIQGKKGEHIELIDKLKRRGYARLKVDGELKAIETITSLRKTKKHSIDAVVDRLEINSSIRSRLTDSVELTLSEGNGVIKVLHEVEKNKFEEFIFSTINACPKCGLSFSPLETRNFSFNSPYGACQGCQGLGTQLIFDESLIIPDQKLPWTEALHPFRYGGRRAIIYYKKLLQALSEAYNLDTEIPYENLPKSFRNILLHGSGSKNIKYFLRRKPISKPFPGIFSILNKRLEDNEKEGMSHWLRSYMIRKDCPDCNGARLQPFVLACTINGKNIREVIRFSITDAIDFFEKIKLTKQELLIAKDLLKEISTRLSFLDSIGLEYLNLDRESGSLSGGEAQRIRLATQIGAGLVGVVYVLDEPSIGLHQRDNKRLIKTLQRLRDLGNTLIIVEHDEETILTADYIVDIGPYAGRKGGKVVFSGPVDKLLKADTLTAKYIRKEELITVPKQRCKPNKGWIELKGASANNLKKIDVKIPLGLLTCITGVSGSGKSTLINFTLKRIISQYFNHSKDIPGKYDSIDGLDLIDKMIIIDQSPIGRTPRSNPATYTGAFTEIRNLFADLKSSKIRGYKPGRFSFNVKGGRCEKCKGDGILKIEMHFLPDVYVPCDQCDKKRYNKETLEVKFKGLSISQVLNLTINESLEYFWAIPKIEKKLRTLRDVGLGYLKLGQSATTLSGGEAQRIKLAKELSKNSTGQTLYILDEPTTGLHFDDVRKLLEVLENLRDEGNSVVVIEHNLDVIKRADFIIDMGPEGGVNGGKIIATGSPEEVAQCKKSFTGQYLKEIL